LVVLLANKFIEIEKKYIQGQDLMFFLIWAYFVRNRKYN